MKKVSLFFIIIGSISTNSNILCSAQKYDEITVIFNYGQPTKCIYALLQTPNVNEPKYLYKYFEDGRAEPEVLNITQVLNITLASSRINYHKPQKADLKSLNKYQESRLNTIKHAIEVAKKRALPDIHSSWTLSEKYSFAFAHPTEFEKPKK